jgi:hypothetical protein
MKEKSSRHTAVMLPDEEIDRTWIVQFRAESTTEWSKTTIRGLGGTIIPRGCLTARYRLLESKGGFDMMFKIMSEKEARYYSTALDPTPGESPNRYVIGSSPFRV